MIRWHSSAGWGRLSAEVSPLVAPVLLLVQNGRRPGPQGRSPGRRARHFAATAHVRQCPPAGRRRDTCAKTSAVEHATDVLWTFSSPELYDLLVVRRGWEAEQFGDFVARGIAGELLQT